MKIAVFSVTNRGAATALRICEALKADYYDDFSKELVMRLYHEYDALVFVMALGIVVRSIASEIGDKKDDPLVIAVDEAGSHVISVLSGHRGANELAREIASRIGGVPVVTTASDVQGKACVEKMARDMGLALDYESDVKGVNAAIVNDKRVGILVDPELSGREGFLHRVHLFGMPIANSPDGYDALVVVTNKEQLSPDVPTAILRPKNLIVGLGARRGIESAKVLRAVEKSLKEANLSAESIRAFATADFKSGEKGLLDAAAELQVQLLAVSSSEIKKNEGRFATSQVVRARVGVGAVCEPSAVIAGRNAKLVLSKRRYDGVTVAIAEEARWENSS